MARVKDLTGQKFGRLTVIKRVENNKHGKAQWLCKCDCGNETTVVGSGLINGNTKSCGCFRQEKTGDKNFKDLTGQKFNRMTVVKRVENDLSGKAQWLCKCDCGNEKVVRGADLLSEKIKSCGCWCIEKSKEKWENENFRQMKSEQVKKLNEQQWQDEEFRQMMKERLSGENNYNYNPNLTEEDRMDRRYNSDHKQWSKGVKANANYVCNCCGKHGDGDLVSHHLNCYSIYKEQRLDLSNGVCLCKKCHNEFHSYMGGTHVECTEQDYINWKQMKQEENIDVELRA